MLVAILGLVDQKRVRKVVLGWDPWSSCMGGGQSQGEAHGASDPAAWPLSSTEQEGSYKPRSDVPALAPGWGPLAGHVNFLSFTWRAGVMTPLRNKTTEEAGTVKFSSVSHPGTVACGKCPLAW